jgi:acyl dehydratase
VQLLASPLHLELLGDADFPLRALGLVHVRNTIDEHRALSEELALDLDAFVESIVRTPRGDEVTLVTEARAAGELVYRASTTALQKARQRAVRSEPRAPRPAPEGELLHRVVVEVPESMGRSYASVAGDLNPIHQHAWLARPFGFPRAIVHGTWTLSRALEVARAELPAVPRTIECSFRQPVMLPSSVALEVRRAEGELRLRVTATHDASFEHLGARVIARACRS